MKRDIHREPPGSARDAATRVARELRGRGFAAYFAGGCVRDRLLGFEPKDYDIATDATPEQIRAIFHRTHDVGAAFGVVLVKLLGRAIEVVTFRDEAGYSDGRHPDSIIFADAERDARRRDFTINGMFEDPESGAIIDFVGGQSDLDAGLVRAIGDPDARLREDRLRMLRAVRFAARFDFELEAKTREAIRIGVGHLEGVSRERIGQEVAWMMALRQRDRAASIMQDLGLDAVVLDELHRAVDLPRLRGLAESRQEPPLSLALAAWWLDRWEPLGGGSPPLRPTGPGHWRRALVLSNDENAGFLDTLRMLQHLREAWTDRRIASRKRLAADRRFDEAMAILALEDPDRAATIESDVRGLSADGLAPAPLLTGDDLVAAGHEPGPEFGRVLDAVYDAQLDGTVTTLEGSLRLASRLLDGSAG